MLLNFQKCGDSKILGIQVQIPSERWPIWTVSEIGVQNFVWGNHLNGAHRSDGTGVYGETVGVQIWGDPDIVKNDIGFNNVILTMHVSLEIQKRCEHEN